MTIERLNQIYDLLVSIGGAYEPIRDYFIYAHMDNNYPCDEWRFGGKLGMGGKYRRETNSVDCYSEDETPERLKLINELNNALSLI